MQDERIIYTYEMNVDEKRISISLATVELKQIEAGKKMTFTEQAVCLDGYNDAGSRERGTQAQMEKLDAALRVAR